MQNLQFTEKELIRNYLNIHKYFINKNRDEIDKIIKNEKEVIKKEDELKKLKKLKMKKMKKIKLKMKKKKKKRK